MGSSDKRSVKQIEEVFRAAQPEEYPALCDTFSSDERAGVNKLVLKYKRQYEAHELEKKRIANLKRLESSLRGQGFPVIAGTDEVGRGPLCGPVVSAVVILPPDSAILYVNDSKQLTEARREALYDIILKEAVAVGIGIVDPATIDRINILNATKRSMQEALAKLSVKPDLLLIDAISIDCDVPQKSIIKGDETVYSIAAASIVAKVTRDRMMVEYAKEYPQYAWEKNKGYGSAEHLKALETYGPSPIHRRSFLHNIRQNPQPYAHTTGAECEKAAAAYLQRKGYSLIETNYRRGGGEIDLILKDGDTYVFCEVKARSDSSHGAPEEFVDQAKQQRLIQTAQKYMAEKAIFDTGRFDVVAVQVLGNGNYAFRHIENAF